MVRSSAPRSAGLSWAAISTAVAIVGGLLAAGVAAAGRGRLRQA